MTTIENISYSQVNKTDNKLDIHLPDSDKFNVFIYFHGGGLVEGDKVNSKSVGEYVANNGIAFVSVNYRMYPSYKYPDFIYDAAEAVNWVKNNISQYGVCEGIYVGGSSAGGYISMMLCFDNKYLSKYDISNDIIKGYIHDAGQPTTHFNVLKERNIDYKRVVVDEAAPLYHIGVLKEYPPMMFIVSDNDMPNRYEQTMLVLSTLKHFGYEQNKIYYKLMHGSHCSYSEKTKFGEIICEFIKSIKIKL